MQSPSAAVSRTRIATLLVLGLTVAGGFFAWRLVVDESAAPKKPKTNRRAARFVDDAVAESRPESLPASRASSEPLAVAPQPGAIRGKVTDIGGIPVNHGTVRFVLKVPPGQRNFALVSKYDESTKVDEEGKFSQLVPGGGLYQVVAEAEGFAPAVQEGVKPGDEIELVLDVGASLTGLVVDKSTGRAVDDAAIVVSAAKGATVRKTKSGAGGDFSVKDLPAGKLSIDVDHPLYVPRIAIEQTVQAGEPATIRIELDAGKSIKGQVLAADDGRQIEGATVTIRKKKATTDTGGRFVIRGLEPESHDIQTGADGYQADQRTINLAGSRLEAVAEIQLNRGATIRGRIQNERSEPVANAELKLFETWDNWSYEDWMTRHLNIKTGEDGTFKMSGIPPREWLTLSLRVRCAGYPETFEKGIKITRADDDVYLALTLRQGSVIAGRVVDQENRPVQGCRLELRVQNNAGWWTGNEDPNLTVGGTGQDGEFKFEGLGASKYTLSAQARGFSSAWKSDLDLTAGGSLTSIQLTLESGTPVKGIVVDQDEKPIAGANVNVWTQKGNGQAVSDAEGKFAVELPKGPYDVYAWAPGFANTRLQRQNPSGDVGLRVQLKREAVLKGTVIDAQTKKALTARFQAYLINEDNRQGGWRQPRWSGNPEGDKDSKDGKFQIQAPQGTYRLEVISSGYVRAKKENIVLSPGTDPEPVIIEMKRGGAIEGIVRAENGQPQPWVQVYVGKDDGTEVYTGGTSSEHDGYFFVGDLDSGNYTVLFHEQESPIVVVNGVYVGGEKPSFVEAQIRAVALVTFEFVIEKPKDNEEAVAGATGAAAAQAPQPARTNWRAPRVRAWVESSDGAPLDVQQDWNGPESKSKPLKRKDIYVGYRQQRFPLHIRDLPAGRFVLHATAKGYENFRMPFQVQHGSRWTMPVEMKLLPKRLREDVPAGPRMRVGTWIDHEGVQREYRYYEDE